VAAEGVCDNNLSRPELYLMRSSLQGGSRRAHSLGVREPDDIEPAFEAMTREKHDAILMIAKSLTIGNRLRIYDFGAANRLPVRSPALLNVEAAEGRYRLVQEAVDSARLTDISLQEMRTTTGAHHIARDALGFIAGRIVVDANARTGSAEATGHRSPDAATGARHQTHLVPEILGRHDRSPVLVSR
jgi:hypothetical protein